MLQGERKHFSVQKSVSQRLKTWTVLYTARNQDSIDASPCILEASTQLVEYCCYPCHKLGSALIIVGMYAIDSSVRLYISHLR